MDMLQLIPNFIPGVRGRSGFMPVQPVLPVERESYGGTMGGDDFLRQMVQLRQSAQRQRLLQDATAMAPGLSPAIAVPSTGEVAAMSDADFFNTIRRLKQSALAQRAQEGGVPSHEGGSEGSQTGQSGPVKVNASSYYEGKKKIAVQAIRIHEVDNYHNRVADTFRGGFDQYSERLDHTQVGKTYRVTVTWQNGKTRTQDVTVHDADGASLSIYHPG